MYLPNTQAQGGLHRAFRADGAIAQTNTPQLILPVAVSRGMWMVMNISASVMFLEHGPARFTATITNSAVSAITIANGGFGYTIPPILQAAGGYLPYVANSAWDGRGLIGSQAPSGLSPQGDIQNPVYARPAKLRAVLTTGVVTSVVIDDGGFGYINPPEIVVENHPNDPFGCASPYFGSAHSGIYLGPDGGFYYINGTACWTDAVSISGTADAVFTVEYMV